MKAYGVLALSGQDAAPTVPQNVIATAQHARLIRITWSASTDDVAVTGYQIFRDSAPLDTTASLTYDDSTVEPETAYSYQVAAFDGGGNVSALSTADVETTPANSPPDWDDGTISESLNVDASYSRECNDFCQDPDGDTITYSEADEQEDPPLGFTQGLPPGVTFNATLGRFDGIPTTAGSYAYTVKADDGVDDEEPPSAYDEEWEEDIAVAGVLQAQNFNTSDFPTRGDLMDYLLSIEGDNPTNGVKNAYTNVAFGGSQAERYMDPIPPGEEEKISLDTTTYVTGGQSVYFQLRASEGATEAGPVIELPILAPSAVYYVRIVYRIDQAVLDHAYGSSHRKICFLNHLDFEDGQIVGVLYLDHEPWPMAYRVDGSDTRQLRVRHTSPPSGYGGDSFQLFGGYDTDPGGSNPTTSAAFNQRFGPNNDFDDAELSDYDLVHRPQGDEWYVTEWMIDQSYVGSVSRGMYKTWGAPIGVAPQLQGFCFRDCGFNDFSETQAESIRLVFRPEDPTTGAPVDAGIRFDSVIVSSSPIRFPGGFTLPHSGQAIPSGQPITNTEDD
jgi:hypothetical protein